MKPPILAIVGPTAVGKTDFFLRLVNDGFNFEAIIADSRQVYKYMDIGTGKDLPADPKLRQKFWLTDLVNPDQSFSSANFCQQANLAINKIIASGSQPVIVGGTGRYIKDFQHPPETLNFPQDLELRKTLIPYSITQLQDELKKHNPSKLAQMNNSDVHNPRRLIRAIETSQNGVNAVTNVTYSLNSICLTAPLHLIKARIEARVHKRLAEGMVAEVESILKKYPNFSHYQSADTPGYQEIIMYLNRQISLESAISAWTKREIDYAKRQLTWFRHQINAAWFDITGVNWYAESVKLLENWGYGRSHSQN